MVSSCSPLRIGCAAGPKLRPAVSVGAQRVAGDQRPSDRPHQRELLGRGDSEHRQPVMAEAAHLLAVVAGQHLGEMGDSEPHLGPERGRQQFARDLGRVDGRRRLEAIVAIAAAVRAGRSPKWRSRIARRQPVASTNAASAFSRSRSAGRRSGSTSCSIRRRARAKSCAAQNSHASAGSPSRPARPVSW